MSDYIKEVTPFLDALRENTSRKTVTFEAVEGKCQLTSSKLGGIPYIPKGGKWPTTTSGDEKLFLLIQINFADVPRLENYPDHGIMQIFIANDGEGLYGLDLSNQQNQDTWRILYYEDTLNPMDESEIVAMKPEFIEDEMYSPFVNPDAEVLLAFKENTMLMSIGDYRFDDLFEELASDLLPEDWDTEMIYDLPDEASEYLEDMLLQEESRLGGYPAFTQEDPRYKDELNDYELLIQIDSDNENIIWGDMGIANFFIHPDDLAKLDFSKVVYNWDCT